MRSLYLYGWVLILVFAQSLSCGGDDDDGGGRGGNDGDDDDDIDIPDDDDDDDHWSDDDDDDDDDDDTDDDADDDSDDDADDDADDDSDDDTDDDADDDADDDTDNCDEVARDECLADSDEQLGQCTPPCGHTSDDCEENFCLSGCIVVDYTRRAFCLLTNGCGELVGVEACMRQCWIAQLECLTPLDDCNDDVLHDCQQDWSACATDCGV